MNPNYAGVLAAKSDQKNQDKWLSFYVHSVDTAYIMERLCELWLPEISKAAIAKQAGIEDLRSLCRFLGMVHDIGKLTARFQKKIGRNIPNHTERLINLELLSHCFISGDHFSHALAGQVILSNAEIRNGVEIIVGSHHGKPCSIGFDFECEFINNKKNYYESGKFKNQWCTLWNNWIAYSLQWSGYTSISDLPQQLDMESQMLLTGLLIMADWIASNTDYFPLLALDEAYAEDEQERVEMAWRLAWQGDNPQPWSPGYDYVNEEVFEKKFGFSPNAVQQSMIEAVNASKQSGIYILEAQMGVGKTEAALAASEMLACRYQCGGLYFGLPTQATSNGIFHRLCTWAEKQAEESYALYSVRLAHGNAMLNEEFKSLFPGNAQVGTEEDDTDSGVLAYEWFQGNKKALLANFVIGTVDQLLMASLKQKHVMLRHLGLSGKVVIIDECHAYDTYMSQYLDRTLNWLGAYGVPVIILSATLPAKRRAELIDAYLNEKNYSDKKKWRTARAYPLLTWTDGNKVCQKEIVWNQSEKKIEILRNISSESCEIATFLSEQLRDGGCAGVIVNTVKSAQKLAEELRSILDATFTIELFHSQFIMPDRTEREKALMEYIGKDSKEESRYKRVIVGTQVLEQSLDLDFDIMLTELCPMDLLLQRIGRLHRHQRKRPLRLQEPKCAVLHTEQLEENSTQIYGEWLLMQTEELLPDEIILPDDIAELVQKTYAEPTDGLGEERANAYRDYQYHRKNQEEKANKFCVRQPRRKKTVAPSRRKYYSSTMEGILDSNIGEGSRSDAKVRDSDLSIDVLVVVRHNNNEIHFLPWQNGGISISTDEIPSGELEQCIASQRLRLPRLLCMPWRIDNTIKQLEEMSSQTALWQNAHLLKGELFLVLDEDHCAELSGYTLYYDKELGLKYQRKDDGSGA